MEQIQNGMLYLLQAAATPQPQSTGETNRGQSEQSDFRKLLDEQSGQAQPRSEETKPTAKQEAQVSQTEESAPKTDEVDTQALQELAAMQMLTVEVAQPETVQAPGVNAAPAAAAETMAPAAAAPEQAAAAVLVTDAPAQAVQSMPAEQTAQTAQPAQSGQTQEGIEVPPVQAPEQSQGQGETASQQDNSAAAKESFTVADSQSAADESTAQETGGEQSVFGQVETAPVKVSDTAAPQATQEAPDVESQVDKALTTALSQGESRVEIQLEPANLGKVTIEITSQKDGALHIALYAENDQTRGLLEKDVAGLQALLSRSSQQEVQVEVPRHQESQQQDFDGHQRQEQERQQQQEGRQDRESGEDFLNQLRLGLITPEEAVS